MINFTTPVRKSRVFDPLNSLEYKKSDSASSTKHARTNSDFTDVARRIVSSSPATCVAIALSVGGIFGWLTSKR